MDWLAGDRTQSHQTRRYCCTYRYSASTGSDPDHYCLSCTPAASRHLGHLFALGFAALGRNHNHCFMVLSVGLNPTDIQYLIINCHCLFNGHPSSICCTAPANCCPEIWLDGIYSRSWHRKNVGTSRVQPSRALRPIWPKLVCDC